MPDADLVRVTGWTPPKLKVGDQVVLTGNDLTPAGTKSHDELQAIADCLQDGLKSGDDHVLVTGDEPIFRLNQKVEHALDLLAFKVRDHGNEAVFEVLSGLATTLHKLRHADPPGRWQEATDDA